MRRSTRIVLSVCAFVIAAAVPSTFAQTPPRAGSVVAWGANGSGQAGPDSSGEGAMVPQPQRLHLDNMIAVAGGGEQSYALDAHGTVWGWGANDHGQIGTRVAGAEPMPIAYGMTAIAAGAFHALALKDDGTVWAWGSNAAGEIGEALAADDPVPHQVADLDHVVAIAAGQGFSLALRDDGSVWGWGENGNGQIGLGNLGGARPQMIQGLDKVVAIAAGQQHAIALKSDGAVWGWGDNSFGELGQPISDPLEPGKIVDGAVAIATGAQHSLALDADGQVWGWGFNPDGRLGTGAIVVTPSVIIEKMAIVRIAAGSEFSLGLSADGAIVKWGDGDGVPTPVEIDAPALAIAAGSRHSLAILAATRSTPAIQWTKPAAITYGTALSAAQLNATAMVNGEIVPGTFSYSPGAGTILNSGANQTLSVTFTPGDPSRFDGAAATTAVDVNRAPLTITAADKVRRLGEANPELTVVYSAFAANESPAVFSSPLTVTTPATAASRVGTYPITPAGASAANYDIAFVAGTLNVTYDVCVLYDQNVTRRSGSTIPIKLKLCDVTRRNVSSWSVALTAQSVTRISDLADAPIDDAGNANPDANFRYDGGLGGYIFNLKTTGLVTGTYALEFSVAGDPVRHRVQFKVR